MNKISKGKAVGLLSLGLASVALGSVGFAAWVVSGTTLPEATNVTVNVGTVTDNRVTVSAAVAEGVVKLDADPKYTHGTLGITAATGSTEDLEFSITVTAKADSNTYSDGAALNLQFGVTMPDGVTDADVKLGSIKLSGSDAALTDGKFQIQPSIAGASATYVFTLAWGSNFGNTNPMDMTSGNVGTVISNLQTLKANMDAGQIKVSITEQPAA